MDLQPARKRTVSFSKTYNKKSNFHLNEKAIENDCKDSVTLVASTGWSQQFMRRNGLPLRRKTSVAQKDPSRLIDKLVSYTLSARRFAAKYNYSPADIVAMDETPVLSDMVSDTTVNKCRISVCLTAKADGSKL